MFPSKGKIWRPPDYTTSKHRGLLGTAVREVERAEGEAFRAHRLLWDAVLEGARRIVDGIDGLARLVVVEDVHELPPTPSPLSVR